MPMCLWHFPSLRWSKDTDTQSPSAGTTDTNHGHNRLWSQALQTLVTGTTETATDTDHRQHRH